MPRQLIAVAQYGVDRTRQVTRTTRIAHDDASLLRRAPPRENHRSDTATWGEPLAAASSKDNAESLLLETEPTTSTSHHPSNRSPRAISVVGHHRRAQGTSPARSDDQPVCPSAPVPSRTANDDAKMGVTLRECVRSRESRCPSPCAGRDANTTQRGRRRHRTPSASRTLVALLGVDGVESRDVDARWESG